MPTELYQEPTPTERALEGEIDALLRVHIIMVRKLEDARLERAARRPHSAGGWL